MVTEVREESAKTKEKEQGKRALRVGVEGLLGFALAGAEPFGVCAPFGIAFCSRAKTDSGGLCCLFGTMLGYMLSRGADRGLRYCAATLLAYSVAFVFRDTPALEKRWFLPVAVGLISLLCGSLSFFEGAPPLTALLRVLLECALAAGGSVLFGSLREIEPSRERTAGLLLLFASVVMSLCRVSVFERFNVGHVPAIGTVLLCAWAGGAMKGCVAGVVMGLCTAFSSDGSGSLALSCALAGLLSGLVCSKERWKSALLFILGFLPPLLTTWSAENALALLEPLTATLLFFCLPQRFLRALSQRLSPPETGDSESLLRHYGALRVGELAHCLRELYENVSAAGSEGEEEDISTVYDRAAECVCAGCLRKELCWHTEYLHMLSGLNDATEVVRRRGKLSMQELPDSLRESCVHPEAFLQAVNAELRAMSYRRQLRARLEENRKAAYSQLRVLSAVLEERSRELEQGQGCGSPMEQSINRYLSANGYGSRASAFRDSYGHLRLIIEGEDAPALSEREELIGELSAASRVKLCRLNGEKSAKRILFGESELYTAAVGIAAAKKQGESVSGDRGTWFKTEGGRLCLLISDGMGSGEEAAREAVGTVRSLEDLLRSGVEAEEALELLNALMLLKNGDSWAYATVDLLTLDLFTGEARFYKYGAAPSYVRLNGEVKRVRGVSLAAGILSGEDEKTEPLTTKLRPGDMAVVCSDGVASEQSDGWLRERLAAFRGTDPKLLARELVEEAERQYGRCDDMTVLVLRLEGREND